MVSESLIRLLDNLTTASFIRFTSFIIREIKTPDECCVITPRSALIRWLIILVCIAVAIDCANRFTVIICKYIATAFINAMQIMLSGTRVRKLY